MATLAEEIAAIEQRKLADQINRQNMYTGPRQRPVGLPGLNPAAVDANAGAEVSRQMYDTSVARGYSPEVSNIMAVQPVENMRSLPTAPARTDLKFSDPADIGLTRASSGQEALGNLNRQSQALVAMRGTQSLREAAGQGMTDEAKKRSAQEYTNRIDGLEARSEDRNLARDLAGARIMEAQAGQPPRPELGIAPLPGGGSAVTFGNNLEITGGTSGGNAQPQFDDVTGRLIGHMVDGKFVRYEHPRNPYPDYDPQFKAWNDANPIPTRADFEKSKGGGGTVAGGQGTGDGIPTLSPAEAKKLPKGSQFRGTDGVIRTVK